jgi:EpsI family protein
VSRARAVSLAVFAAALAVLYAGTAEWAAIRYAEADSFYSHGFLVWPVVVFLYVRVYRSVRSRRMDATPRGIGFLPLGAGLALLLASHLQALHVTAGLSLLPVLAGGLLLFGGRRAFAAGRFPLLFALSGIPLPLYLLADATLRMKLFAAESAAHVLSLLGIESQVAGSILVVRGAELLVGDPCSGLRSLIALLSIGALFSHLSGLPPLRRLMLFVLSAPFALASNVFRIAVLGGVAGLVSEGAARAAHDTSGILVYVMALGLLALAARLLRIGARPLGAHLSTAPAPAKAPIGSFSLVPSAASVLILLSLFPSLRLERREAGAPVHLDLALLPSQIGPWEGDDVPVTARTRELLGTDHVLIRRYRHGEDGRDAFVCVVFSADDRKAVHPPEVCYRGGGGEVLARATVAIGDAEGSFDANAILVSEQGGAVREVVLYWYRFGDEFSPSYLTQQWRLALDAFLGREGSAALVRLSAVVEPGDDENAVAHRLSELASAMLPSLRRSLL